MGNLSPAHIYECAKPAVLLGLFFGVTPMAPVQRGVNHQLITNNGLKLIALSYLTVYTLQIYWGGAELKRYMRHQGAHSVTKSTTTISTCMAILTTYVIYYQGLRNVNKVKGVLTDLLKIDAMLNQLGQKMQYRTDLWFQLIALLSMQLLQVVLMTMQIWNGPKERLIVPGFKVYFIVYLPKIIQNLVESHFVLLAISLHQRFTAVNRHLRDTANFLDGNEHTKFVMEKIDTLMRLHDNLCDTAGLLDEAYGGTMFISSLTQFELIVTALFSAYINYSIMPVDSQISFAWCTLKCIELLRKVAACHVTANEAKSTKVIVHKLLLLKSEGPISVRLMEFSQQLMHRQIEFTAQGMFQLDATLIFTVVSTVTTYMVILYQFNEAAKPPTCFIGNTSTPITN